VISPGVATVGDYTVTDGTNVLSYLQGIEKAEPGRLFIDKLGRIVFKSRYNDLLNPSFEYTRVNLSNNPGFETNVRSWVTTAGSITRSTATALYGTASGNLSAGGVVNQFFDSQAAQDYTVSLYAKTSSGTATLNLAGLESTDGTTYTELSPVNASVVSASWTRISTTFTASSVFSGIRISQTPSSGAVFIDGVLIEASPVLDAFFDGANDPVYNTSNPDAPDYQPERVFETYETEWVL
jgi:hypothetical protein